MAQSRSYSCFNITKARINHLIKHICGKNSPQEVKRPWFWLKFGVIFLLLIRVFGSTFFVLWHYFSTALQNFAIYPWYLAAQELISRVGNIWGILPRIGHKWPSWKKITHGMEKSMGLRFLYDQSQHSDERPGLERRNMNAYSSPKNLSHQKWCPCLLLTCSGMCMDERGHLRK